MRRYRDRDKGANVEVDAAPPSDFLDGGGDDSMLDEEYGLIDRKQFRVSHAETRTIEQEYQAYATAPSLPHVSILKFWEVSFSGKSKRMHCCY